MLSHLGDSKTFTISTQYLPSIYSDDFDERVLPDFRQAEVGASSFLAVLLLLAEESHCVTLECFFNNFNHAVNLLNSDQT